MANENIVLELCDLALERYRRENPEKELNERFIDSLYFSIAGVLRADGIEAAKKYVLEAELVN